MRHAPGIRRVLRWPHLPATGGYALLTLVVLWPAVQWFSRRAMVDSSDSAVFEWAWWAMPRALARGENPYDSDMLFHPVGTDLAATTTAPLVSALTWPVQWAAGTAAQVNTVQLASMFTAGLAMYFLAHRVCGHRGAAFVSGAAFALLPHRFVHVDSHLNLIETGVLPLGILAFLRLLDVPSHARGVQLGVVGGAAFLIDPHLALLLATCLVPLVILRRADVRRMAREIVLVGASAVLVAAPLLFPLLGARAAGESGEPRPTPLTIEFSSSPLSWVVPPFERLQLGRLVPLDPLTLAVEGIAHPGLVMLGLALAGAALGDRANRRGWVAMAAVGVVLSLGPYLYVRDTFIEVPLPFFGLRLLPGFEIVRAPGRFALVGAVGILVLAAIALAHLARRSPGRATLIVLAAGALTIVELAPRALPERTFVVSPAIAAIAQDPGTGAVLDVPIKWATGERMYGVAEGRRRDFMFMVAATVHGRPIVSGSVSRYPEERLERLLAIPVYRQLLALQDEPGIDDATEFGVRDLQELGIGYVVYHRDDPVPTALPHLRSLGLELLADDGTAIVWKVP
jgi:hypothetical protein